MSLLDLARSLDLVETINVNGKDRCSQQQYKFAIVIDFEATCWDREQQTPSNWLQSEIIEFPAVLVNLQTHNMELEFQKYVMPIESPCLSAFCTNLTGITQDKVDDGCPLPTVIMLFNNWLQEAIRKYNLILPKTSSQNPLGNTAFVTWSDWDFGVCLKKECERKRIKKPSYFDQWIDLKAIFKEWYKYKPISFSDAIRHVGIEFIGREHSGIDDSRNIAKLTCQLVHDGATLRITKDLKPFLVFN